LALAVIGLPAKRSTFTESDQTQAISEWLCPQSRQ
jgi:hypothetical protein